jgi:hypothetical protein
MFTTIKPTNINPNSQSKSSNKSNTIKYTLSKQSKQTVHNKQLYYNVKDRAVGPVGAAPWRG